VATTFRAILSLELAGVENHKPVETFCLGLNQPGQDKKFNKAGVFLVFCVLWLWLWVLLMFVFFGVCACAC